MADDVPVVSRRVRTTLRDSQVAAVRYSRGLRHQLSHGLELLTENDPLCQWDGELLPLEAPDYQDMIAHGTERGYQQHRRHNVPMCQECLQAKAVATRRKKPGSASQ